MNFSRIGVSIPFVLFSLSCSGGVAPYDIKQPPRDGLVLVGMECHHKNHTLELGVFFPISPPQKRMDLWSTSDLVSFDSQTHMLEEVRVVEKRCNLGDERFRIRFEGLPGANNAMWVCGASTGAHAKVWRNEKLVFDGDLYRCNQDGFIKKVSFKRGIDAPEIEKQK